MSKAERDARYLSKRKLRGLCARNGCKAKVRKGATSRCQKHAEEHAAAELRRHYARRALKAAA